MKKLKGCAKNAGYTGGSRQARAVGRAIGSELEERRKETEGTDRFGGMKAIFLIEGDSFKVTYKVAGKRKAIVETYPFLSWDEAKELVEESDIMDIAIHQPNIFWLAKYHKKTEELTSSKRRK